jgi:hypothetical protein
MIGIISEDEIFRRVAPENGVLLTKIIEKARFRG